MTTGSMLSPTAAPATKPNHRRLGGADPEEAASPRSLASPWVTHDEGLRVALRAPGLVSNRYESPEYSDEFEWPPSTPRSPNGLTVATGTVIYLEPGIYWVFAPQNEDNWWPPEVVYDISKGCLLTETTEDLAMQRHG